MVHFLSLTIIGTILSAAAGIQAQIDGGILCADPNYSGTCFNVPKACCVDISVLLPTNGVTSFVPLNGSTCQMFTSTHNCNGTNWSAGIALSDFSKLNYNGISPDNAPISVLCQ